MIKVFALLPKTPDLSDDEFHRHWREVHAPLVLKNSTIKRYIQSHRLPQPFPGFPTDMPYAGVAELWFAEYKAFERCWSSAQIQDEQLPDTLNFVGGDPIGFFGQETHIL